MLELFKLVYLVLTLIKPNTNTRVIWDLISISITAAQLWYIPLISCFPNLEHRAPPLFFFQKIPLMIFTFDILFNFITGYYSKGHWIEDKTRVAKHYLKKEFWIDIVTLIPIYIVYSYDYIDRQWSFIFMIRLVRMQKIFQRAQEHFKLQKVNHLSILSLITLGLKVFFSVHIGACFWHYQSTIQMQLFEKETWLVFYNLADETWFVRYINCFYFIIVTMVTVGYGDFSPQNTMEKFFVCFFVLFGCGQFGYCLNKIGSIFQQMYENESKLQ